MSLPLLLAGIALLVALTLDVFWTALGRGAGVITRRVANLAWRATKLAHRLVGHRLVLLWGSIYVLMSTFLVWVALLWTGWVLVYSADPAAVAHATTLVTASLPERIYFVGYVIFTLGMGDFIPTQPGWQLTTAFASLSGLFLVTFSITYLVPIVQAATDMRTLAVRLSARARTPQALLFHAWNREGDCTDIEAHLQSVTSSLALLEQRHLTYPVLHYFHSTRRREAVALAVATVDEALTILAYASPGRCGVDAATFRATRQSIAQFLATLGGAYIEPADEPPPPPSLDELRQRGFPLDVDDETFARRVAERAPRRRLLLALVDNAHWPWGCLAPEAAPADWALDPPIETD